MNGCEVNRKEHLHCQQPSLLMSNSILQILVSYFKLYINIYWEYLHEMIYRYALE